MVLHLQIGKTVKAKLLIAFGFVVCLTFGVGAIGWLGFSKTEEALTSLQRRSLPDIASAMALAQRSSALAALAPFVGSVQVINRLDVESERLSAQLEEFKAQVKRIRLPEMPDSNSVDPPLQRIADQLDLSLRDLISTTHESLSIRSDFLELRYNFDHRGEILAQLRAALAVENASADAQAVESFGRITETIVAAMTSENPFDIDDLQSEFDAVSRQLAALLGLGAKSASPSNRSLGLDPFLESQARVFELRRREFATLQRTRYLLSVIHTLSTQLSDHVTEIARRATAAAQARSQETTSALEFGKSSIAALAVASVMVVIGAAFYLVRDLAGNLQAVTRAMTVLAGGDRSVSIPATERTDELGSLARAFDVFKDHSFERERLARRLVDNSRTLEAVFGNMTDGLSVFDSEGRLVSCNPQFVALNELGERDVAPGTTLRELQELLGEKGVQAKHFDGRPVDRVSLGATRASEPFQYEEHFPNGRIIELRSQPMASGGFVTTYTDLTEQRRIERQLRQAQRMEAVGQLTGGIAHDFNNLLAAICGNLQMLHEALHENEDLAGKILRALDAAERGASLTQRLLAFSRQQALQPEVVDVNHLVLGLVDLIGYSMATGIEIKTELSSMLGPMLVDPGQLENAILNLIFNSRDALPNGGVIRVATFRTPKSDSPGAGESISVCVSDNGVGMTSEVAVRAYEPFFTTKGKERGSGLGLSMVYGFVKQSGGQISISSSIGIGTEVTISLPRADCAAIAQEARSGRGAVSQGRESVLIVEDDPAVRAMTADMVCSLGYRTIAVSDGVEAIAELEREAFDLLLTDVILPNGSTGPEVAMRAVRVRPRIGVLYTSGYALDLIKHDAPLPGNAKLLKKPFRKERLAQAIRQELDRYGASPTLSTSAPNL